MFGRRQRRRQELHCHECQQYVQFVVDLNLNGNHVLNCPNCGHEHCRVVKDGVITEDRWDSRNGGTYAIPRYLTSATSTATIHASSSAYFTTMTNTYGTSTSCTGTTVYSSSTS